MSRPTSAPTWTTEPKSSLKTHPNVIEQSCHTDAPPTFLSRCPEGAVVKAHNLCKSYFRYSSEGAVATWFCSSSFQLFFLDVLFRGLWPYALFFCFFFVDVFQLCNWVLIFISISLGFFTDDWLNRILFLWWQMLHQIIVRSFISCLLSLFPISMSSSGVPLFATFLESKRWAMFPFNFFCDFDRVGAFKKEA